MALAPVFGSLRKSRKVAIDSTLGLRRLTGLKSKSEEIKQRQTGDRDQKRADDNDDAMLFEEVIDRRQERIADGLFLTGWIEQPQQGRQHRDAGRKGDQHPNARDLAELRNAFVVGWQE